MQPPRVYLAIAAVAAELAERGVPKGRTNQADGYDYRSIDDILAALAPVLAKHRLCVLPKATERHIQGSGTGSAAFSHVVLRVAYELVSAEDGSNHVVEVFGEGHDGSDKGTAKALAAAYKAAMIQTFCIPVVGTEEPDRPRMPEKSRSHVPEPVQGWRAWSVDIVDIVGVCESAEALDLLQQRNRDLLSSISRESPELYAELGRAFKQRRELLSSAKPKEKSRRRVARRRSPFIAQQAVSEESRHA